jgi:hypothetical protein
MEDGEKEVSFIEEYIENDIELFSVHYIPKDTHMEVYIYDMTLDEEPLWAEGSIKWDGCSNIKYHGHIHYCGMQSVDQHKNLMEFIYGLASENIEDFDKDSLIIP